MKTKSHPLFRPALILMSFLAVLFTFSLQGCASITRDLTMSCSEQYRSCEDIRHRIYLNSISSLKKCEAYLATQVRKGGRCYKD